MCARYNLRLSPAELQQFFDVLRHPVWDAPGGPDWRPRYNVAPTQPMPILRHAEEADDDDPHAHLLQVARWGLIPAWSREPRTKFPLVNARAETVATAPTFRAPFKRRRCLVPATGFYEWTGPKGDKQPHHIGLDRDRPFAFAGLWDRWGEDLESFTIVTCPANDLMAELHDRMPVILPENAWATWCDPATERGALEHLLVPYEGDDLRSYPSNRIVNNVRNETPECLEPA